MPADNARPLKLRRVSLLSICPFCVWLKAAAGSTLNEELLSLRPSALYGMLSYPAPLIGGHNHPHRIAAAWWNGEQMQCIVFHEGWTRLNIKLNGKS